MENEELSRIVEEITGSDNYKIKKGLFNKVYRLEEKEGLLSKIARSKAGKAVRTCIAGVALAAASIPAQTALDYLIPKHSIVATAEASQPRNEFELNKNDAIVLGSNMLVNALMGGYGSHKQHNPHTKFWKDPNFWKGFKQGAIGGIPVYVGMKTMTFQNEWEYSILLGKQISDLGTSITYSASLGENWLENPRYMTDIGPLVLSWNKERGLKPELFVLPVSGGFLINNLIKYDLNTEQSLKTGLFVFDGNPGQNRTGMEIAGRSDINLIIVDPDTYNYNKILSHEAIHTRNNFQFMPLDSVIDYYLKKTPGKLKLLSYENHPFRFGAAAGFGLLSHSSFYCTETGVDYNLKPLEFASSNLFNFEE